MKAAGKKKLEKRSWEKDFLRAVFVGYWQFGFGVDCQIAIFKCGGHVAPYSAFYEQNRLYGFAVIFPEFGYFAACFRIIFTTFAHDALLNILA